MFSGIIEKKAKILHVDSWNFVVENTLWEDLSIGQSVAHDGACMTLTHVSAEKYTFFVMQESLNKTNFAHKKVWDYFNIERSLKVSDRIDWHFVSGHIDTTWNIIKYEKIHDGSLLIGVEFSDEFIKNTIQKWSIALNWVSLTIAEKNNWYILVSLIPLTQEWTNLWNLSIGDTLNIEFDLLGKYILNTK